MLLSKVQLILNIKRINNHFNSRKAIFWLIFSLSLLAYYFLVDSFWLWDWMNAYRPASVQFFMNGQLYPALGSAPPWAVIPYLPLALLNVRLGGAFLFAINVLIILLICRKLGGSWIASMAVLVSYPAYRTILHGQLDAIASLGFVLSPVIGLFFLVMKPQITIGFIVYLIFDAWSIGGIKKLIFTFAPVSIMVAVGTLIYGPFWQTWGDRIAGKEYNVSLWPVSIPIGFYILVQAIRNRNKDQAITSSVFFSPYFVYYSWIAPLFGVIGQSKDWIIVCLSLLSWIVKFLANWP